MVSKNNQWQKLQQQADQVPHFGIRKLSVGVASVLIGLSFMGLNGSSVKADTNVSNLNGGGKLPLLVTI